MAGYPASLSRASRLSQRRAVLPVPAPMPAKKKTAAKKAAPAKTAAKKTGAAKASPPAAAAAPATAQLCRLKFTLSYSDPLVWRTITVPYDIRLDRLHLVIQEAMGWHLSYLWKIIHDEQEYLTNVDADPYADESMHEAVEHRVRELLTKPGDTLVYVYDMGDMRDEWLHDVTLESVLPEGPRQAVVTDGANACPPEDCGGIQGYYQLLETLADPEHEDHEDMMEMAGGPIDAKSFDLELARKRTLKVKV